MQNYFCFQALGIIEFCVVFDSFFAPNLQNEWKINFLLQICLIIANRKALVANVSIFETNICSCLLKLFLAQSLVNLARAKQQI